MLDRARASAATRDRRHRSAPHRDRRRAPTCTCRSRPARDVALFNGLLAHLAERRTLDRDFIDAPYDRLRRGARARARDRADAAATARATGLDAALLERFYRLVRRDARAPSPASSQGVNQSRAGTDKVNAIINCHLATGPHRPARHGAVLAHRPAQRHGRARGRRPGQHARRRTWASRPSEIDGVRPLLGRAAIADAPGPQGGRAVRGRRGTAASRRCGSWRPIRPCRCRMPTRVRAALRQLDLLVVSETCTATDTIAARAHVLLPAAAWGEKDGTVTNSERRISRQRALPAAARRGEAGLVDRRARSRSAWASARPSPIAPPPNLPRARRAVGFRERRRPRFRHRRPRRARRRLSTTHARARAMAGAGRVAPGRARFFADGRFFTPDRQGPLRRRRPRRRDRPRRATISASSSTPAACAISGTP